MFQEKATFPNSFSGRATRVINLFTIKEGISKAVLALITQIGQPHYRWVNDVTQADYLVFPTNYEVSHELTDYYLAYFNGIPQDRQLAVQYETAIIRLSKEYNKKIIVFYFSDSDEEIPVDNAIVFRTSLQKSANRPNEHIMPPFKHDLSEANKEYPEFLTWGKKPSVGFRGQAAPLKLTTKMAIYNQLNLLSNRMGLKQPIRVKTNYGYLQRRNALVYLNNNKSISTDFTITSEKDVSNENSVQLFRENLFSNPYNVCARGFGNYSYRFYETISCGRIPVFINTNCKLPFEEFINWKDYVVWVEESELHNIAKKLIAFNNSKRGEAFILHQQKLKKIWLDYLCPRSFLVNIKAYL